MKKIFLILAILALALVVFDKPKAEFLGSYGQFFVPEDTVRVPFSVHDTTGLTVVNADSIHVLRYYRDTRIDSLDQDAAQVVNLRTGGYVVKFKADKEGSYSNANEDSIGQYTVIVEVWKNTKRNTKSFSYQVLRGRGLHDVFDQQMLLASCDGCFRVLYPVGSYPKDSVQLKRIDDKDGDGNTETGDTTHIASQYFYHSNISRVMDSSKVIFHRDDL